MALFRALSPSHRRVAIEALLSLLLLAFLAYDLSLPRGRHSGSHKEDPRLAFSAAPSAAPSENTPNPVVTGRPLSLARLAAQAVSSVSSNNTFLVCGSVYAPGSSGTIGSSSVAQALVFQGSAAGCLTAPMVLQPNSTALAGVGIAGGSWFSLENVQTPSLAGAVAFLNMEPNSHLQAVVPASFTPNPNVTQLIALLTISGPCPALTDVNTTVENCPYDPTLSVVGSYVCALATVPTGTFCSISLSIAGVFTSQATAYLQLVMSKDCLQLTQVQVKVTIYSTTGVPIGAIVITYWQCASIVAVLTVLGSTPAQATAALNLIYQSALSGPLRLQLGVLSATLIFTPVPTATTTTTAYYNSYNNYGTQYGQFPKSSSSNPALFALFALLAIPLLILLGLLFCCCRRKQPCPTPKAMYMAPPVCPPIGAPVCPPVIPAGMAPLGSPPPSPIYANESTVVTDPVLGC